MGGKKARKIRKKLGMTKHNLRNPEYGVLKTVKKTVYFKNKLGELSLPMEVERQVIVNKSVYKYKRVKKELKKILKKF